MAQIQQRCDRSGCAASQQQARRRAKQLPRAAYRRRYQSGRRVPGASEQCRARIVRKQSRSPSSVVLRPDASSRPTAYAGRVLEQRLDHELWPRNDGAAAMPSFGIEQIDGHGSTGGHDAQCLLWVLEARPDQADPAINAQSPGLAVGITHTCRRSRAMNELRRTQARATGERAQLALHPRAGNVANLQAQVWSQQTQQPVQGTVASQCIEL